MPPRLMAPERRKRERAAKLATRIGCPAAARKHKLTVRAVYQMMCQMGLKPPGIQPTAVDRKRIAELSQAEGVGAIAASEGVSVAAVKRYRQERGLTGRLTHRQLLRIIAESKRGRLVSIISQDYRIHRATVSRILQLARDEGLL